MHNLINFELHRGRESNAKGNQPERGYLEILCVYSVHPVFDNADLRGSVPHQAGSPQPEKIEKLRSLA